MNCSVGSYSHINQLCPLESKNFKNQANINYFKLHHYYYYATGFWATVKISLHHMLPLSVLSVCLTLVYCGQTVNWIKMVS